MSEKVVERKVLSEPYAPDGTIPVYGELVYLMGHGWRIVAERVEEEPSASERLARKLDARQAEVYHQATIQHAYFCDDLNARAAARLCATDPERK